MSDAPILIHIGYHKTGSTWLQRTLFNDAATGFAQPWTRAGIEDAFICVPPFGFDYAATRAQLDGAAVEAVQRGLTPVLSHERLAGNGLSAGFDSKAIADRLGATYPGARVLIVFREQVSMVCSVYLQYVRNGGTRSPARFLSPPTSSRAAVPMFDPVFFEYDRLVAYYRSLFSPERVLALPYERFAADPAGFAAQIAAFAGRSLAVQPGVGAVNPALSGLAVAVKRPLNRLLVRDRVNPGAPIDSAYIRHTLRTTVDRLDRLTPNPVRAWSAARLRGRVERTLGDRYRKSNARLASLTGIDLDALGYPVDRSS